MWFHGVPDCLHVCARVFLDVMISLLRHPFPYGFIDNRLESPSRSWNSVGRLASEGPVRVPKLSLSDFPQFEVSLLILCPLSALDCFIYSSH